jgi:hypothetical protein
MKQEDLLRNIAETAYNVGYGAKKHFATYDITAKMPGIIAFTSTAVGVFSLLIDFTSKKYLSALFIVLGVVGLRIGMWDHKKAEYAKAGEALTAIFNKLKDLYFQVKALEGSDCSKYENEFFSIRDEYSKLGRSDQILFSDWYAHYKFFWQQQIKWVEEKRPFGLWRDKLPLSFSVCLMFALIGATVALVLIFL